jgi:hypothetical protein
MSVFGGGHGPRPAAASVGDVPADEPLSTVENHAPIPEFSREELGAVDAATRARMLGVDYEALRSTAIRLRVAVILAIAIPIGVAGGVAASLSGGTSFSLLSGFGAFLVGALTSGLAAMVGTLLPGLLIWAVMSRTPTVQQAVVMPFGAIATAVALWFAVQVNDSPAGLLGCVVGALVGGSAIAATHSQVPAAIRMNSRGLQAMLRQYLAVPNSHTLVGGTVRWIVAAVAARSVSLGAMTVIFAVAPHWFYPVLFFTVLGDTAAAILTVRGRPKLGTWIDVGEALVLLVAAILLG